MWTASFSSKRFGVTMPANVISVKIQRSITIWSISQQALINENTWRPALSRQIRMTNKPILWITLLPLQVWAFPCLTLLKSASSRGVCESDYFFCGRQPQLRVTEDYLGAYSSMPAERLSPLLKNRTNENRQMTRILPQNNRFGSHDLRAKRMDSLDRTISGYCIPQSLQCDGIVHCHNARDELPSLRIEPSQIPGHLLRDLVGAHLVPTDLQNVGCVRYRINDQRPRIRQNLNASNRSRRLSEFHILVWPIFSEIMNTIHIPNVLFLTYNYMVRFLGFAGHWVKKCNSIPFT